MAAIAPRVIAEFLRWRLSMIVAAVLLASSAGCALGQAPPSNGQDVNEPHPTATAVVVQTLATPTATPVRITPIPRETPTPTPLPVPTPAVDPRTMLDRAASALRNASSFEFDIYAIHRWTFEGKAQEFEFRGEGAFARPGDYRATIEGPIDVTMTNIIVDSDAYCADTRGRLPNCSYAWGGPGPGSSPYTVISYLLNFDRVEKAEPATADAEVLHLRFTPDLALVAALDGEHARMLGSVTAVDGEVWIDRETGLPRRQTVMVWFKSRLGSEESVEMTLDYHNFDGQVEIELPDEEHMAPAADRGR